MEKSYSGLLVETGPVRKEAVAATARAPSSAGPPRGEEPVSVTLVLDDGLHVVEAKGEIDLLLEAAATNGTPCKELPWRFDATAFARAIEALPGATTPLRSEVVTLDGTPWQVTGENRPSDGKDGARLLLTFVRAGERERLHAEIRALEASLCEVVTHAPGAVALLDGDCRVLAASPAFGVLAATPATSLAGLHLSQVADGIFASALGPGGLSALTRGELPSLGAPFTAAAMDGHTHDGVVTVRRLEARRPLLLLDAVTPTPVSIEERPWAVLDRLPMACVMLDRTGRLRFANQRTRTLLGRVNSDLLQENGYELLADGRLRARFEEAIAHERLPQPAQFERPLIGRHGERHVLAWHAVAERDAAGCIAAVFLVGLDVSRQRDRDRRLSLERDDAREAGAIKSRLIAAAGRDLQRPLQTLRLLHGVLARRVTDAAARDVLATLGGVLETVSGVFELLLDVGRMDALPVEARLETLRVQPLLDDIQTRFADEAARHGHELRVVATKLAVRTDRTLLGLLLSELVAKAIRQAGIGRVLVGCRRRGDDVRLVVATARADVSLEQLRFMAEQLKIADEGAPRGQSFGLDVVRPLTQLPGHQLEVTLALGGNATFAIRLPRSTVRSAPAASAERAAPQGLGQNRFVLVISDEAASSELVHQLFSLEEFDVRQARTASAAIAEFAGHGRRPDLLVIDDDAAPITQVLRVVRSLHTCFAGPIPTVVLTSQVAPTWGDELLAEAIHLLRKPVTADALLDLAAELIAPAGADHALALAEPPARWTAAAKFVGVVTAEPDARAGWADVLRRAGHAVATAGEVDLLDATGAPVCLILDLGSLSRDAMLDRMEEGQRRFDAPQIVVLEPGDVGLAVAAMRAGALDVLAKPVADDVLRTAVLLALHEQRHRRRREDDVLVAHHRFADLTPREHDVLRHLVAGASNKDVAAALGISPRTVENHRARIMEKTKAASLAELVRLATTLPPEPRRG
ncbi:MAG: hypothetical protein EA356_09435 [Geminicoccaceae bacterium]|nr:MAG: hypothetical protein EA356_09435 [Geminicoccaceae bacterium]